MYQDVACLSASLELPRLRGLSPIGTRIYTLHYVVFVLRADTSLVADVPQPQCPTKCQTK